MTQDAVTLLKLADEVDVLVGVIEAVRGDRGLLRVSGTRGDPQDVGVIGIELFNDLMKRNAAALRQAASQGSAVGEAVARLSRPSVNQYVADYEFRGDQDHAPTEDERTMLEDAIEGYLATAALSRPVPTGGAEVCPSCGCPTDARTREEIAQALRRNGFTSRDGTMIQAGTFGVIDAIIKLISTRQIGAAQATWMPDLEAARSAVRDEIGSRLCHLTPHGTRICTRQVSSTCLCEETARAALCSHAPTPSIPSASRGTGA